MFMQKWAPSIQIGQNRVRVTYSNNPINSGSRDHHHKQGSHGLNVKDTNDRPGWHPGQHAHSQYDSQQQHHQEEQYHQQGQHHSNVQHNSSVDQQNLAPVLNVGAQDIGKVPNAILLITNVSPMVNETHIWNALKYLGPLKRILTVKDRNSKMAWGFCFVEFEDVESATVVLEKTQSSRFRIHSYPVSIHYAHLGSFIPAYAPTRWTIDFRNDSQLALYWDEQAFLSEYSEPTAADTTKSASPSHTVNKEQTSQQSNVDELDAFYATLGNAVKTEIPGSKSFSPTKPSVSTSSSAAALRSEDTSSTTRSGETTNSEAMVEQSPQKKPPVPVPVPVLPSIPTTAKIDKEKLAGIAAAQAAEQLAKAEEKKKRKAAAMVSTVGIAGGGLKVSKQLQRWSTKQVELQTGEAVLPQSQTGMEIEQQQPQHQPQHQQQSQQQSLPSMPTSFTPSSTHQENDLATQEADPGAYEPDELLDLSISACLLCQRRLKSLQDLRKHQSHSELHKKNLQDPTAIANALKKSRASATATENTASSKATTTSTTGVTSASAATTEEEPKYRDRAAERRHIFGQPDYPLPPTPHQRHHSGRGGGGGYGRVGNDEGIIIPEQPTKDGIKEDNIGNRLLKSMGWKEGQGLGKDGEGIKAPIEASGYSQGVGIGAGLVRKPGGVIRGPLGNYAESAKDLARRRYEESS
ncbi:hypothetical protein BGZ94_009446 [Podila epigama]|nr:hypothetical protein BGZ94_009446 [Podila epigama]